MIISHANEWAISMFLNSQPKLLKPPVSKENMIHGDFGQISVLKYPCTDFLEHTYIGSHNQMKMERGKNDADDALSTPKIWFLQQNWQNGSEREQPFNHPHMQKLWLQDGQVINKMEALSKIFLTDLMEIFPHMLPLFLLILKV